MSDHEHNYEYAGVRYTKTGFPYEEGFITYWDYFYCTICLKDRFKAKGGGHGAYDGIKYNATPR